MIHQFISSFINSLGRNNFQTTVIHQFDIPIPYDHVFTFINFITYSKMSESIEFVKETVGQDNDQTINSESQEGVKRKRNMTKRSKVWDHFVEERLEEGMTKEQQKAKCLHCGAKYLCDSKSYDLEDPSFGVKIRKKKSLIPTAEDWTKARKLCVFLKTFQEITLRISGTKYVTSHTLVVELAKIRHIIREQAKCDLFEQKPTDEYLYDIAKVMKPKFDKYFGDIDSMNLMLYFSFLLDPRNKEEFLEIILEDHY
ncbi:hypothetical protein E3N88_09199 [Mikania micrantha]|uniref:hAT-like transposase RNase-H fold domain-containing protein n=1 Tax=Mikania micrantha TaxID=192012 RepID=A0A5N6PKM9_9ASTR|nr:hypothetical protein E3N88_09199 [Mikania micrantha]